MIGLKNLVPQQAKDYYTRGFHDGGRWFGAAARSLKLGKFKEKDYNNLLEGRDRAGRYLLTRKRTGDKCRAGTDCTLSAPKSVSLQALVAGDDRLIAAHRHAVERTLEIIERDYAVTRITEDGERFEVVTGNLAIALFDHIEARPPNPSTPPDPHLHTHCVIVNLTHVGARWHYFANERLFRNQKTLRALYGHVLGDECEALGYRVCPHPAGKGEFEIEGIDRATIESFSRRWRDLTAFREREGVSLNTAWRATRARKQLYEPDALRGIWKQQAASAGVRFPELTGSITPTIPETHLLTEAIETAGRREVYFLLETPLLEALTLSLRPLNPETLRKKLNERTRSIAGDQPYPEIEFDPDAIAFDPRFLSAGAAIARIARLRKAIAVRKGMGVPLLDTKSPLPISLKVPAQTAAILESIGQVVLAQIAANESGITALCLPSSRYLDFFGRAIGDRLQSTGYGDHKERGFRIVPAFQVGDLVIESEIAVATGERLLFLIPPGLYRRGADLLPIQTIVPFDIPAPVPCALPIALLEGVPSEDIGEIASLTELAEISELKSGESFVEKPVENLPNDLDL
jgi:conjugative relaxase-like TrwC/TraI family protein